jgi:hypothetical protein
MARVGMKRDFSIVGSPGVAKDAHPGSATRAAREGK